MWSPNNQVQGKGASGLFQNLHCLADLITRRHYHQNVHVTVFVRLAVRVRAEEDNCRRVKLVSNLTCIIPDDSAWDQFAIFPMVKRERLLIAMSSCYRNGGVPQPIPLTSNAAPRANPCLLTSAETN